MNRLDIIKTLIRHRTLAEKRAPWYPQKRAAKIVMSFFSLFTICYMMFISIMLSLAANDSRTTTALEFMMGALPVFLLIDFGFRWMVQQTPLQIIKPYLLLPLPRYACIDAFVLRSIFNSGNITWYAILLPYCLMSVVFSYGFLACVLLVVTYTLFILANSQWYAIVRTLTIGSSLWWLLAVAVYALASLPLWLHGIPDVASANAFFDCYATLGTWLDKLNIMPTTIAALLLAMLTAINRKVQYHAISKEMGQTAKVKSMRNVSQFHMLDRYGEIGQYLKLEIKSLMRNKNPRKVFIAATELVIVITLACSFSDIYDGNVMTSFWCIYNLAVYGCMILTKVMGYEQNYMDALMIRKETIFSLLRAKYYFFCALTLVPLLLLMPTVIMGKWSLGMILSYALFTIGFQYFVIMQLAVYNKTPIPLNTKLSSSNGGDMGYIQAIVTSCVFIVPVSLVSLLSLVVGESMQNLIMASIGMAFVATHKIWLRNIYIRMMKKR